MTSTMHNPADELRRAIAEGRISQAALQVITSIDRERLAMFLDEAHRSEAGLSTRTPILSGDESVRLSVLAGQLIQGMEIDDDDRLRGILEGLTIQFTLTTQNIALLTHTSVGDVEACLTDPGAVSPEVKFPLAVRASYLNLAIANARRQ